MKGIGYFLGSIFGAAAVFFIISYIFLRPRDVEESQVKKFIQNSDKILIKNIPWVGGILANDDERLGIDILSKTTYFSNRNMSYIYADTYTYFSKEFNKYIKAYYMSAKGSGLTSKMIDFGDSDKDPHIYPDLYFYYNKTQNADKSYGTIDKPLPILFFVSSDPALKSVRPNNLDSDKAYLEKEYQQQVTLYLQYFIEKEDFKKLFPEK
ncbi:hypothetical protein [Chryseobacterium sp. CT-SW4]|uniref:hypothetical protein n=1 Tax=Chryseobacterium sp. SW-1 TaxID=3157343 RepID=UPI003B0175DA